MNYSEISKDGMIIVVTKITYPKDITAEILSKSKKIRVLCFQNRYDDKRRRNKYK